MFEFLTNIKNKLFGQSLTDLEKQNPSVLSCLAHLE